MRTLLMLRYWLGCIFCKTIWHIRTVTDSDNYEELVAWTKKMNQKGWQDFAAFGDKLYLKKNVPRWKKPK